MIKIKNFLVLLLVLFSVYSYAQLPQPTLIGTPQKYSAKGAGTTGIPTINYPLPNGKNRIVIVSMFIERDRSATNSNLSVSGGTISSIPYPYINGAKAIEINGVYNVAGNYDQYQSSISMVSSLLVSDSWSGTIPITYPDMTIPATANDEVSVIVATYENVAGYVKEKGLTLSRPTPPLTTVTFTGNATYNRYIKKNGLAGGAWNPPTTIPIGRVINDFMFLNNAVSSKEDVFTLSSGWTKLADDIVYNTNGTNPNAPSEYTGISQILGYQRTTNNTVPTSSISVPLGANYVLGQQFMFALLPLAAPSVSGQVVTPTLDATTGTQGGGLWMNVVDKSTNKVVAVVAVDASGNFTIPVGTLIENYNYDFILSKNAGFVGTTNPITVALNTGWVTVAEGVDGATSDGTANSIFNFTMGAANVNTLRFAINYVCNAGTTQVPLSGNTIQN